MNHFSENPESPVSEDPTDTTPLVDTPDIEIPTEDTKIDVLNQIQTRLTDLQQSFDQKIKYDAHKEQLIDRLHQELQTYKADLQSRLIQPLLLDIIQTIDEMNKLIASYHARPVDTLDPQKLLQQLQTFPEDLKAILYRQGVDVYQTLEHSFDPQRHRVLKREETHDPALDKQISHSLREGYLWGDKILRPELVSLYRLTETIPPAPEQTIQEERADHEPTDT